MNNRIDRHGVGSPAGPVPHPLGDWAGRTQCGNLECPGRWRALLKDRRRPMFEGRWGCSSNCIRQLVAIAIRREAADESTPNASAHRHRIPLGLILLERGWISLAQLNHALEMQRRERTQPIGYWLVTECGVAQSRVTRALAMQWGCPALTMEGFDPSAMALVAPRSLMERYGVVPVKLLAGRILYLAFADRPDASAAFAIERLCGIRVESGIVDSAEWTAARDRIRQCDSVSETLEQVVDADALSWKVSSMVIGLQPRASRLVRVHQFYWLRLWLEHGAMTSGEGGVPKTGEDVVDRVYTLNPEQ